MLTDDAPSPSPRTTTSSSPPTPRTRRIRTPSTRRPCRRARTRPSRYQVASSNAPAVRRYHKAAGFHSPQRRNDWEVHSYLHRPRHPPRRQAGGRRLLLHHPRVRRSRHRPSSRVSSSPRLTATAQSRSQSAPRRAASSSAPPATCTSTTSNSILRVRPPQRDPLPRLLGKYLCGRAPRDVPIRADHRLTHISSSPPFACPTARPCRRSERHFSAFAPPSSTSGSSDGHGGDLTLARLPPSARRSQWGTRYTSRKDSFYVSRRARSTYPWPQPLFQIHVELSRLVCSPQIRRWRQQDEFPP